MNPFPEEWELLSLFESEPTSIDRGVPWFYNCLIFETTRDQDHVRCELEPGYEILRLRWWHGSQERLALDLHWVHSLRVVTGGGRDYLIAAFRDEHLLDLEFHLKPVVCLRWGTSSRLPDDRS